MEEKNTRPPLGSKDEGYLLEWRPGGIFLTVWPSSDGKPSCGLADMRKSLLRNGITEYDIITLARIVREATGEAAFLARPPKKKEMKEEPEDQAEGTEKAGEVAPGKAQQDASSKKELDSEEQLRRTQPVKIVVEVSHDRMKAVVRFDTKDGVLLPTADAVLAALAENKVVYGIDKSAVEQGVGSYASFLAAQGVPPKNGENARIERNFDLKVKGHPKMSAHDRVDYKDMNLFVLAKQDQLLAVRIPQTKGTPGHDVFGTEIAARGGQPIPMPNGKNTVVRNQDELYATINGQIVDNGKKIEVDPRFVVNGDVSVGTGNIDFDGSVEVQGNIEYGFSVKATGDIEVKGNINGGSAEGRNIVVSGGIIGKGRSLVSAREDVRAAFTEHANVEAKNAIIIADAALHSTLRAGHVLSCEEKRGQIMGGSVAAGVEIRAKVFGNMYGTKTLISVGIDPELESRYHVMLKDQQELRERLTKINQVINTLEKVDVTELPPERAQKINALIRQQFPLAGRLKRMKLDIEQAKKELDNMASGTITALDCIQPGCRLLINGVGKEVESPIKTSVVSLKEDAIAVQANVNL